MMLSTREQICSVHLYKRLKSTTSSSFRSSTAYYRGSEAELSDLPVFTAYSIDHT